jgi:DNA-binding NarL/FixJ family response regulator
MLRVASLKESAGLPEMRKKSIIATSMKKEISTNPRKCSVYLIDDHPVILQGISMLINSQDDLCVAGTSTSWATGFKEIPLLKPDVVTLDISLESGNGIEVLKNIKTHFPTQKVLMLSMHDENLYASRSMKAGAWGYLMKVSAADEVPAAIRQIMNGGIYLSPGMSRTMMSQLAGRQRLGGSALESLSDRELEVYEMVGDGLTTRLIANRMHLSVKTIETHKSHIKEKLSLKTGTELAQHAVKARI